MPDDPVDSFTVIDCAKLMRYAHFAPEAGKAAVDALDKILDLKIDADRVEEHLAVLATRSR